jgi:hypothetical protein
MIKQIKEIIHYILIYFGVYFPTYLFLSKKLQIDIDHNYWYTFGLIFVSLLISNLIENWYELKE